MRNGMIGAAVACLVTLLTACGDDQEDCNQTRVAAYEGWSTVEQKLQPACATFQDRFWEDVSSRAHQALAALAVGRGSGGGNSMLIEMAVEGYKAELRAACNAVRAAKSAANGGALKARETGQAADEALGVILERQSEVLGQLRESAEGDDSHRDVVEALSRFEAHSQVLESADLPQALEQARSASAASWEACKAVDP